MGDFPIRLSDELQLGIHDLEEELTLRLRKDREFLLMGRLPHEPPILKRDGEGERRAELVHADVACQDGWIDRDARAHRGMEIRPTVYGRDAAHDGVGQTLTAPCICHHHRAVARSLISEETALETFVDPTMRKI